MCSLEIVGNREYVKCGLQVFDIRYRCQGGFFYISLQRLFLRVKKQMLILKILIKIASASVQITLNKFMCIFELFSQLLKLWRIMSL